MGKRDPRVDAYIAKAADFAKPILTSLRETVHAACPEVEETLKWSSPTFMYHGMLCGMAAFKAHCAFGFWKHSLIVPESGREADAMGQFGRITSPAELPPRRVLAGYVRQAMQLNETGTKVPRPRGKPKPPPAVPADLKLALNRNKRASATFKTFSPTNRRDYVEWITEAKTDATRQRRLETAVAWIAEGKSRNWKYE